MCTLAQLQTQFFTAIEKQRETLQKHRKRLNVSLKSLLSSISES